MSTKKKPSKKSQPKLDPSLESERNSHVYVGGKAVGTTLVPDALHFRYGIFEGPDKQHMAEFETAFRTDPIINRALNFVRLTMLASIGDYTHEDERAVAYVQEMFDTMDGNFLDELGQLIISALWAGVGVSEKVYEPRDGKVYLKRLVNYHPRSLTIVPDRAGRLTDGSTEVVTPTFPRTGLWQRLPSHLQTRYTGKRDFWNGHIRLPLKKMVMLTHNKRHGNVAGESALAPVWLRYQMALETWQNLMITTERYGSPQVAAIVPKGITSERVDTGTVDGAGVPIFRAKTLAEKAAETLANLNATSALVFEEPAGLTNQEKVRLQNISTFNNFGESFLSTITHLYTDVMIGLGVPPLLFLEHSGGLGAGAIAQIHAETYKQMITALYHQFVEPFCEQVIGQLLYVNFGITDPGHFTFNAFDLAAADTMIKVFTQAVDAGILDTSVEEDLQWSRNKLGIPLASSSTLSARLKNNKVLMSYVRQPDKDKIRIAEVRADGSLEGTRASNDNQSKIADKQIKGQHGIVDKQIEAQKELAKLNNDAKLKTEREKTKAAQLETEAIMSGAAASHEERVAQSQIAVKQADADAAERKAKAQALVNKSRPVPKPGGPATAKPPAPGTKPKPKP